MKSWIFGVVTVGWMVVTSSALACPTGFSDVPQPRPRPVQTVSFQASQLVEQASRLESAASSHDQSAMVLEQQADILMNRARVLQNQAQFVAVADRPGVFDLASELVTRSNIERSKAADERMISSELRTQARSLRNQATQLVRVQNPGGWRSTQPVRRSPMPNAGVPNSDSAVTL